MEYTKLKNINFYKSENINPSKYPNDVFEMYSVPIYETGHPEYLRGEEIASSKSLVKKNDILLCKINPRINRVWIVKDESDKINIASSEWIVIRNDEYNPEFLAWYLRSPKFQKLMTSEVTGIGGSLTRAQPKRVAEYPVPVLPLREQNEIANVLNKAKRIIDNRKQELFMLDELIKARFIEMFYDKGYPILKWNDVFTTTTGKLDSNAAVEDGEYPFFTCSKEVLQIDKFAFDQEALLLAGNNAAGKYDVKYYNGKFNAYQRTYVLGLKEDWSYQLFRYQLEDKLVYLQQQSLGGLTKYLTMKILGELDFIIPPIEKQIEFEVYANQVDKSKAAVQKSLDETQVLFDSLMQKYFG